MACYVQYWSHTSRATINEKEGQSFYESTPKQGGEGKRKKQERLLQIAKHFALHANRLAQERYLIIFYQIIGEFLKSIVT